VPAVIELDKLEVRFGQRTILSRLSGSFDGRAIGLLGPNGAGKSTLINTLLGFHPPAAGTARILGLDVAKQARQVRSLVGYMPESDSFIASMSGVRFVRLMAELAGLPAEQALERTSSPRRLLTGRNCCCSTSRQMGWTRRPASA